MASTPDRRTRIVFITRNLDRAVLENTLKHFETAGGERDVISEAAR